MSKLIVFVAKVSDNKNIADEFAALVRHIIENSMLNGEVIRLGGALRMAAR